VNQNAIFLQNRLITNWQAAVRSPLQTYMSA